MPSVRCTALRHAQRFPPVDRWQTVCSNGWAFITAWNIGICIDITYPVDRWNECEGVVSIPWSVGPLANSLANG